MKDTPSKTNQAQRSANPSGHDVGGSDDDHPVLSVIRDVQAGRIELQNLAAHDRHRCVEHFTNEGFSTSEMAEILVVAERTISRDRAAIRRAHSLQQDPRLVGEMAGQLLRHAENAVNRIRRITRERSVPASARIDGEKACWTIVNELVARLQSLGHLPTAAQHIRGDLTHHLGEAPGYDEVFDEVARLEVILLEEQETEHGVKQLKKLALVKQELARSQLSDKVHQLAGEVHYGSKVDEQDSDDQ